MRGCCLCMTHKVLISTLLAIVIATPVNLAADDLQSLLERLESLPYSEITVSYTLSMPLLDDDVDYILLLRPDSITATPSNEQPPRTQCVTTSQFSCFLPDSIAAQIRRATTTSNHTVTYTPSDSTSVVTVTYAVDSIVGALTTYIFDENAIISITKINNPSTLTEQTITVRYTALSN